MGPLHTVSDYAIQIIKKMQNENIRSWVPRQEIVSFADPSCSIASMLRFV